MPGDVPAGVKGYEPAYDGLRGIAILLVVAFHLGSPWTQGGFLGVDIFFVLSGFLITSRLIDELESTGDVHFRRCYARRALRLLPALVILLAAGAIRARSFFAGRCREPRLRAAGRAASGVCGAGVVVPGPGVSWLCGGVWCGRGWAVRGGPGMDRLSG